MMCCNAVVKLAHACSRVVTEEEITWYCGSLAMVMFVCASNLWKSF